MKLILHYNYDFFYRHAVSRTQQGRQKQPIVKTLRSSFSAEFWRRCVLNGGTQRHILPQHQSEEIKTWNISFPWVGIEPTTCHVYSHTLCLWPRLARPYSYNVRWNCGCLLQFYYVVFHEPNTTHFKGLFYIENYYNGDIYFNTGRFWYFCSFTWCWIF